MGTNESLHTNLKEYEREYIKEILLKYKWNKVKTARALDIGLSSLYRKITELGITKKKGKE